MPPIRSQRIAKIITLTEYSVQLVLDSAYISKNDIVVTEKRDTLFTNSHPTLVGNNIFLYDFRPITNITVSPDVIDLSVGEELYVLHNSFPVEHKWKKLKKILEQL